MPAVVVATYNVHGGVDGWGRPFDVVDACRRIDADVLVLQECWTPEGGVSTAERVAGALGGVHLELALARGRIAAPPADTGGRWGPRLWARSAYGLRLARRRQGPARRRGPPPGVDPERGTWGIAMVSRLPVVRSWTIELPQLRSDPARRGAIVADLEVDGVAQPLRVVGTHLAHLRQGSPRHIAALRRELRHAGLGGRWARRRRDASRPGVLAGDMNLWGPPLSVMFPGWSRAVRGRSWPTWTRRPLAQSDHILVTRAVMATGAVLDIAGSDHFPVRATLVIGRTNILQARDDDGR
jgi:endonuclease/exonuclease/phosphatase family metal-dependent hydrolase